MSFDEKTAAVAHHVQPDYSRKELVLPLSKPSLDNVSSDSTLAPIDGQETPSEEYDGTSQHPFSAFYLHPTTRTSLEQSKSESKDHLKVYEHDLEAGSQTFSSLESPRPAKGCGGACRTKMGHQNLCVQRSQRRWSPFRNLSKRQFLFVKILIALFIVGVAVGIGIGISKAVGAGIWKNNNSRTDIH